MQKFAQANGIEFENAQVVSLALRAGGLSLADRKENLLRVCRFLVSREPVAIAENDFYLGVSPNRARYESRVWQKLIDNSDEMYIGVVPYELQMPCVAHGTQLLGQKYSDKLMGYKVLATENRLLQSLPTIPTQLLTLPIVYPNQACTTRQALRVGTPYHIPAGSPGVIGSEVVNGELYVTWESSPNTTKYGFFSEVSSVNFQ